MRLSSYIVVTTLLVLSYSAAFGTTIGTLRGTDNSKQTNLPRNSTVAGRLEFLSAQSPLRVISVSPVGGENARTVVLGRF
jgi:hypothetical protein